MSKKQLYRYSNRCLDRTPYDNKKQLVKTDIKGLYRIEYPVCNYYGYLTIKEAKKEAINSTKKQIKALREFIKKLEK